MNKSQFLNLTRGKETEDMDRHLSYIKLGVLAEEIDVRSGLRPIRVSKANDPGDKRFWEDLADSSGRVLRLRRVARSKDPATKGIHALLCERFSEDEADTLETIQTDAADPDVAYFVIHEKGGDPGDVLALINVYVLPIGAGKLQLFIGYVVTKETEEGKGLAARLYRAAYLFFMRRAEIKAREAYGIVGEMVETVEEYFLRIGGCRRVYAETPDGAAEIPYIQPPLDFDKATGEPATRPVSEHLMIRLVDYVAELTAADILEIVWSIYESYFFGEEDFESAEAYQRHCAVISEIFEELKRSLPDPSTKVFMMNHAIRTGIAKELKSSGKELIEIET